MVCFQPSGKSHTLSHATLSISLWGTVTIPMSQMRKVRLKDLLKLTQTSRYSIPALFSSKPCSAALHPSPTPPCLAYLVARQMHLLPIWGMVNWSTCPPPALCDLSKVPRGGFEFTSASSPGILGVICLGQEASLEATSALRLSALLSYGCASRSVIGANSLWEDPSPH